MTEMGPPQLTAVNLTGMLPAACTSDDVREVTLGESHADSEDTTSHPLTPRSVATDMDSSIRPLAVERFDSKSVTRLQAILGYLGMYIYMAVDQEDGSSLDDECRMATFSVVAVLKVLWSWSLIIRWEQQWASHTGTCWIRPPQWTDLLKPSAFSCLVWFRICYWLLLLTTTLSVSISLYTVFDCGNMDTIQSKQCVVKNSGLAWSILIFTYYVSGVCTALASIIVTRLFLAFSTHEGRCWTAGLCSVYSCHVVCWVAYAIGFIVFAGYMSLVACDLGEHNYEVWYTKSDRTWVPLSELELTVACGFWGYNALNLAIGIMQFCAIYWSCTLSCCSSPGKRNCCPCDGQDVKVPKWALLMSRFYFKAIFPPQLCLVVPSIAVWFGDTSFFFVNYFMYPLVALTVFNTFLYAFVPPGANNFLCLSLTYDADELRSEDLPWRLVLCAWGFANDAYKDDKDAKAPTESGEGPLTWRRRSVAPNQQMHFVSCVETDTHVQLLITEDMQLVVSFRGTGSLSNLGTDCSVSRIGIKLDEAGLHFAEEDSAQSARASLGIAAATESGEEKRSVVKRSSSNANAIRRLLELCSTFQPTSILITGHSLGGALATLFTLQVLAEKLYTPSQVWAVTFGQPRVGNHAFAYLLKEHVLHSQFLRIVNAGDLVAGVPKMLCLFKHVGVEVEINAKGHVICEPSPLERDVVTKAHKSAVSHKMTNYEVGLQACVRKFCNDPDAVLNANICVPFDDELKDMCCTNCGADVPADTAADREGTTNEALLVFCDSCAETVGLIQDRDEAAFPASPMTSLSLQEIETMQGPFRDRQEKKRVAKQARGALMTPPDEDEPSPMIVI